MSCYEDIYNDFPLRCAEIWESFDKEAKDKKLDVTFMLICAAGGFSMPWEHFKIQPKDAKNNSGHPAFFGYSERDYTTSLNVLAKALKFTLADSPLFRQVKVEQCFYGHAKTIDLIRNMAECRKPSGIDLATKKPRDIVKLLRNALAHNNIYTFSREKANEISELAFFSEVLDRSKQEKTVDYYEIIVMEAEDFHAFLSAWFELLRSVKHSRSHLKLLVSHALVDDNERITAYG